MSTTSETAPLPPSPPTRGPRPGAASRRSPPTADPLIPCERPVAAVATVAPQPHCTPAAPTRSYGVNAKLPPLGRGAFGVVFHGNEKTTGEHVAVKLISKRRLTAKDIAATHREVAMLRKAGRHPHLLQLLDFGEDERRLYIVTPVVEGGGLKDALSRCPDFTEDDIRELLRNVLSGVAHLHDQGVMHRDIKLDNILLRPSPDVTSLSTSELLEEPRTDAVLIDFGFATDEPHSTTFCGTPYYIAPEVIAAGRDKTKQTTYDNKCDVWSFGVLAYTLLNDGAKPFVAKTTRELLDAIERNTPAWTDGCSPFARTFVESLLVTDPVHRPTAAQALQHPWLQPQRRDDAAADVALHHNARLDALTDGDSFDNRSAASSGSAAATGVSSSSNDAYRTTSSDSEGSDGSKASKRARGLNTCE